MPNIRLMTKHTLPERTIVGPPASFGTMALAAQPATALSPPITTESTAIGPSRSVQNRAADGGVINKATIRIPTLCSPITVTATTRPVRHRSSSSTGQPCAAAVCSSKHRIDNSLNRNSVTTSVTPAAVAIRRTSPAVMVAAEPRIIVCSPA